MLRVQWKTDNFSVWSEADQLNIGMVVCCAFGYVGVASAASTVVRAVIVSRTALETLPLLPPPTLYIIGSSINRGTSI